MPQLPRWLAVVTVVCRPHGDRVGQGSHPMPFNNGHPVSFLAPGGGGSVPNWHKVRLANGAPGFVPKRWPRVIPMAAPPTTLPTGRSPQFWVRPTKIGLLSWLSNTLTIFCFSSLQCGSPYS
jgi:hypothetical protein